VSGFPVFGIHREKQRFNFWNGSREKRRNKTKALAVLDTPPERRPEGKLVVKQTNQQAVGKNNRAHHKKPVRTSAIKPVAISAGEQFVPRPASAEHLDRLSQIERGLENTNDMAEGLFFLIVSHMEKQATETRTGTTPSESAAVGIMLLGDMVSNNILKVRDEIATLGKELGRGELARLRLAAMDAELAAKGGAQ
jgi:hypothetical protein